MRPLSEATVIVNGHGVTTGPPAAGVLEYLARHHVAVTSVFHPLMPEDAGGHLYDRWAHGRRRRRTVRLPSRPPLTFPLDLLMPIDRRPVDLWIGFDNLSTTRGLTRRTRGRVGRVVHWAVDFVPDRFGPGSPLTRAYDTLDAMCCRHADLRTEVSTVARDARNARHHLDPAAVPTMTVPIGLWVDEAQPTPVDACKRHRAVFIGHLVERMGVDTAIEAIAHLRAQDLDLPLDVVGHGPERVPLEALAAARGVTDLVTFWGFQTGADLKARLAGASIALAPYQDDGRSFTQFADPSKLKSYLSAGLPILLTPVPPNARELQDAGAAEVVADDPAAFAAALARLVGDDDDWAARREAALRHAARYDWSALLEPVFAELGFTAG